MRMPLQRPYSNMLFYWRIAAIIFLLSALPGFSQESGKELSLPDYIAQLDSLAAAAGNYQKNPELLKEWKLRIPQQWIVRDGNRSYQVKCEYLTDGIDELLGKKSDEACRSIQDKIAVLKADAQALQLPAPDESSYRKTLGEILARREFSSVRGPNLWDQWKQRIKAFIDSLIFSLIGLTDPGSISVIAIWSLIPIAVIVLAIWIFRAIRQNTKLETVALQNSVPVSAKSWTDWLADAHAAAAKECWREAVHLSYWAGISFLESQGLWKPDRARTPREYLRLLPASSEHRSSLAALTGKFEPIWYGYMEAEPESFSESLRYLERLGCHSN
jgi:hypothetical protein